MKILITGGAGFIASHIVDKYIELGHEVVVVDDLSSGKLSNVNPQAKFYNCDISEQELIKIFKIELPDVISHHAAQISVPISVKKPQLDLEINIKGLINLLEACVKYSVKKVIFSSSGGAIYGEAVEYPTDENYIPKPLSPYGINKYFSEVYLNYFKQSFGLDFTILRYSNVYGPRQIAHGEAGVVSVFIEKYFKKEIPHLFAYPEEPDGMIRDYIFVNDVVNANILSLEKASGEIINIGSGIGISTGQLLREISLQMKKEFNPFRAGPREGDLRKSCLNIKKALKVLNWKPEYNLSQGLNKTITFFNYKEGI